MSSDSPRRPRRGPDDSTVVRRHLDDDFDFSEPFEPPAPAERRGQLRPVAPVEPPASQLAAVREVAAHVVGNRAAFVVAVVPDAATGSRVAAHLAHLLDGSGLGLRVRVPVPVAEQDHWADWIEIYRTPDQVVVVDGGEIPFVARGRHGVDAPCVGDSTFAALAQLGLAKPVLVLTQHQADAWLGDHPEVEECSIRVRFPAPSPTEREQRRQERVAAVVAEAGVTLPDDVAATLRARADRSPDPEAAEERLLRQAIGTARLARRLHLLPSDVPVPGPAAGEAIDVDRLRERLTARVKGQTHAVEATLDQLVLGYSGLAGRPGKPRSVLLLVGPSGVGKTQLAKAVAEALFGSPEAMIRLDMSEYEHPSAITRLIGPSPGYKGSTEPAGWLTTKVLGSPRSVLLLDEIEKAHPQVLMTFLQVFDEGRLTDGMGRQVDFCETVVFLTSNLGSRGALTPPSGFGGRDDAAALDELATRRIREAVRQQLAPELIGRLDDVVVLNPLREPAVAQIVSMVLDRVVEGLAQRGWSVTVADGVVPALTTGATSLEYGARHVQKVVERSVVLPVLKLPRGPVRVDVVDGEVTVEPEPVPVWTGDEPPF